MENSRPLWKVQREAIDFTMERPATMLNMDMGTGKTRVVLEVLRRSGARRVLVVAPKSVVPVWAGEVQKHLPGYPVEILKLGRGPVKVRAERLGQFLSQPYPEEGSMALVVLSYDIVWRDAIKNLLVRATWDCMVLDESHRAKSHNSKTSRACHVIGRRARRRICMSGTPLANSPLDVFGQYRFLDESVFGTSWTRFVDEYGVRGGPERRFIVGFRNLDALGRKFNRIAYTATKEDIREEAGLLDEPESTRRVGELSPEARRVYNDLRRDFVSEHRQGLVVASNVLVRMLRFQQITSGFIEVVDEEGRNPEIRELGRVKPNMLRELLEDLPTGEPLVVFYKFRRDAEEIRAAALDGGREAFELSGDRDELGAWRRAPAGVLAVQYQSGAVGVDLTRASYGIYYSGTFSLSDYQQSRSRLYRPGQTRPVLFIHLVIEDTIDETIMEALESKQDVIQRVLETGRV